MFSVVSSIWSNGEFLIRMILRNWYYVIDIIVILTFIYRFWDDFFYLKLNCDSVRAFIVCRLLLTNIQVIPKTIASSTTNDTTHSITVNEIVPAEIFFFIHLIQSKLHHMHEPLKNRYVDAYNLWYVKYILSYTCKLFIHYTNKKSDANAN